MQLLVPASSRHVGAIKPPAELQPTVLSCMQMHCTAAHPSSAHAITHEVHTGIHSRSQCVFIAAAVAMAPARQRLHTSTAHEMGETADLRRPRYWLSLVSDSHGHYQIISQTP